MGFIANFIRFQQYKSYENRLRFDKVTESLKVGTFLRHGVNMFMQMNITQFSAKKSNDNALFEQILTANSNFFPANFMAYTYAILRVRPIVLYLSGVTCICVLRSRCLAS